MAATAGPTQTIALVTGANRGIGRAVAAALARDFNYTVILGCRDVAAGRATVSELRSELGIDNFHSLQLDLNSDTSISAAAEALEKDFGRLDVLINNAGIFIDNYFGDADYTLSTRELFELTFNTNVIGTAVLTEKLLPLLRRTGKTPRIVFLSSLLGSLHTATDSSTPFYNAESKAYDASKAAVNMLALNYARLLKDIGGKSNAVCPGLVATSLTRNTPHGTTPEVGARRVVEMATLGGDGPTGTYSSSNGDIPF
jgi:NAD(P)-dependent dehydrogenase (short-subunit alcohol dehydrogenase family)